MLRLSERHFKCLLCRPTHTFIGIIILNFVIEVNLLLSRIEICYACRRLSSVTLPSYITICDVIIIFVLGFSAFFSGYHSLHCCQTYLNNLFTCHIELFLYLILTNDKCVVSPMGIRILSVHEMCKQLSGQQIRLSLPRCPVFESHYRRLGLVYLTSLFTSNSHYAYGIRKEIKHRRGA